MIIIGDIHSCARELEVIINNNKNQEYISVGDMFDRGELGVEVWNLIHEFKIKAVMGNHEYKLLSYLKNERDNLPWHYFVFLNEFRKRYNISRLIEYLENLPYIIQLTDGSIVAHGAVDCHNPLKTNLTINVFGNIEEKDRVPLNPPQGWWDDYEKTSNPLVYYGHIVFDKPNIRNNSIGLDTGACYGGGLTYYNTDTLEIKTVESKDYFGNLKLKKNDKISRRGYSVS